MRLYPTALIVCLPSLFIGTAKSDDGFSGLWKYNSARSEVRNLPAAPDRVLKVEQNSTSLKLFAGPDEGGPFTVMIYPLDGRSEKQRAGEVTTNTMTKWEGSALLVNTLVSGPQNYTVMERWKRSKDGATLTIKKTVVRLGGESESLLVYENPAAAPPLVTHGEESEQTGPTERSTPVLRARSDGAPVVSEKQQEYLVESGTRILLSLRNAVNTKHTSAGDRIYLDTMVPIVVDGRVVIPRGSYVIGTVTESKQAGRVKGRSALNVQFDSLTLPNGVSRDLRSRAGSVDGRGNVDRKEGRIEGESNKGGDARTVGETTAAGAGIGTLAGAAAGHMGMGAGIGAAAGAAAGLGRVLTSRGPDVVLPRGTSVEMVLDRDLRFTAAELGRVVVQ